MDFKINLGDEAPSKKGDKAAKAEKQEKSFDMKQVEGLPYLKIDREVLADRLAPFFKRRIGVTNIIASSILVETDGDTVTFKSSDVIAFLYTTVKCDSSNFRKSVVVDTKTLEQLVKYSGDYVVLIEKDDSIFAKFLGGDLFVTTYDVETKYYNAEIKENSPVKLETATFIESMRSFSNILKDVETPEMAFYFYKDDRLYVIDPSMISSETGKYTAVNLPQSYSDVLISMLENSKSPQFSIDSHNNFVVIRCETSVFAFPKPNIELNDSYTSMVKIPKEYYTVSLSDISTVVNVFLGLPLCSGLIAMNLGKELVGKVLTRKGEESNFVLSRQFTGPKPMGKEVNMSLEVLNKATSIFDGGSVKIGISDKVLTLFNDNKSISVLLNE